MPVNNAAIFGPVKAWRASASVIFETRVQEFEGLVCLFLAQTKVTIPTDPAGVPDPCGTSAGVLVSDTACEVSAKHMSGAVGLVFVSPEAGLVDPTVYGTDPSVFRNQVGFDPGAATLAMPSSDPLQ